MPGRFFFFLYMSRIGNGPDSVSRSGRRVRRPRSSLEFLCSSLLFVLQTLGN